MMAFKIFQSLSSKRLGHCPFTARTWVRVPSGTMHYIKNLLKELTSNYWIFKINFLVSLFLLWLTPVFLLLWLIIFTAYLRFRGVLDWDTLNKTWTPIFGVWYLILVVSLAKYSPVIIGPGYTEELISNALMDEIFFERICFVTIFMLHVISAKIGFPILIPMFNIFNKDKPTSCAGEDIPKPPQSPSGGSNFGDNPPFSSSPNSAEKAQSDNWFGMRGKTKNQKDSERCAQLADQMAKTHYRSPFYQHQTMESKDGTRVTHNVSTRIPGIGVINSCFTLPKKHDKEPEGPKPPKEK